MSNARRYERINTCAECGGCQSGKSCDAAKGKLRRYSGVRFTSDGFDCALPVAIDTHSHCSYGCLYCFSDNLIAHREQTTKPVGQIDLCFVERILSGAGSQQHALFRQALKYDRRNAAGYPTAIQVGAINDPLDNIERQQGIFPQLAKLAIKYSQPLRISTKGKLFLLDEYLNIVKERPELFWVAFSIISPDDEMLALVDKRAPSASERLASMKRLSDAGVKCSLRLRPIIPGISDRTKTYPKRAYRVLIEKAAEAGAVAISYEVAFLPGFGNKDVKRRWKKLEELAQLPLTQIYRSFGANSACIRPSYTWTEEVMHDVAETAKKLGLVVGVSDPVWKQLSETGCCCGILPSDPVFGNWQEESATNQLLLARELRKEIGPEDVIPAWAYKARISGICNPGVGPKVAYRHRHIVWADELKEKWNDLESARGPLNYFQGALIPVRRNGDGIFYKYVGLERQKNKQKVPYWSL